MAIVASVSRSLCEGFWCSPRVRVNQLSITLVYRQSTLEDQIGCLHVKRLKVHDSIGI